MFNKWFFAILGLLVLGALPALSNAQTPANNAPLGSKDNPIRPTTVSAVSNPSKSLKKGKRGSKTNPIAGSVHPRTSGN